MFYAEINVRVAKKEKEVRKEEKKKVCIFERSYFRNCFGILPSFLSWVHGSQFN